VVCADCRTDAIVDHVDFGGNIIETSTQVGFAEQATVGVVSGSGYKIPSQDLRDTP
jgi:hypothetical protein